MEDSKIIKLIENTLSNKIKKDSNYIRYTFYELRVKYNLSEEDTDRFLFLIRTKLENENYKVYFTGAKFMYNNAEAMVQDNELIITVKEYDNTNSYINYKRKNFLCNIYAREYYNRSRTVNYIYY